MSKAGASSKPRACGSGWPKRKRPGRSARRGSVSTARPRCSSACSTAMTGISARSSTTIWTKTARPGAPGCRRAPRAGCRSSSWSRLRGGKLVTLLPEGARRLFARSPRAAGPPAEWALRWLWDQPEVTCVLSGMNSVEMVEENCRIADAVRPHTMQQSDFALLEQVKTEIARGVKAPCTGCGYCMPCPKGVDIPAAFRCYNEMYTEKKGTGRREYWQVVSLRREPAFATQCVGCRPLRAALPAAPAHPRAAQTGPTKPCAPGTTAWPVGFPASTFSSGVKGRGGKIRNEELELNWGRARGRPVGLQHEICS